MSIMSYNRDGVMWDYIWKKDSKYMKKFWIKIQIWWNRHDICLRIHNITIIYFQSISKYILHYFQSYLCWYTNIWLDKMLRSVIHGSRVLFMSCYWKDYAPSIVDEYAVTNLSVISTGHLEKKLPKDLRRNWKLETRMKLNDKLCSLVIKIE